RLRRTSGGSVLRSGDPVANVPVRRGGEGRAAQRQPDLRGHEGLPCHLLRVAPPATVAAGAGIPGAVREGAGHVRRLPPDLRCPRVYPSAASGGTRFAQTGGPADERAEPPRTWSAG